MVVSEGAINNIMGGMENTAGVRLHSHRHKLKQRFDIVRKLGQGTYGKVQLAINKETGQEVAIKTIKKAKIETEQDLIRIRREIQIMSSVQHPQIIHIYEVFENREKMVLVMEYAAGGELYDYLSERKVLSEPEARRVFRQVASAVYYCHKHKICHRDLKLENILLDLEGNAKIADFGLSNVFDEKQRLDTFCGSPLYASPEIVKGIPYAGPEVDCWSLGVLLYTLVYGAMPFDGSNFRRLVKQITQGDFYEPSTPATASELIRHMLTVQSSDRATIEDICSHWWVNEGYADSCLAEAAALANQTPVRLDLLLTLAPKHISSEHMLIQPDDEEVVQRSDTERLPPNLKLPPPPSALPDGSALAGESLPLRSQSLGAVPPGGKVNAELQLDKKEDRKQGTAKKPPSKPPTEDEKKKKKEDKYEDDKKRSVKKRSSSSERERVKKREASTETERERVKKRETSLERERVKKRESANERKKRESSSERKKAENLSERKNDSSSEAEKIEEEKNSIKIIESPLTKNSSKEEEDVVTMATLSPTPSTDLLTGGPKGPSKTPIPDPIESKASFPKPVSQPKPIMKTSLTSEEKFDGKKPDIYSEKSEPGDVTEAILKETVAKIESVEEKTMKNELPIVSPVTSPVTSPPIVSPVTSCQNSIPSSQATSPVRSRTGSESSTEAQRPSRSESGSRRQSKIFSKAALFDPLLTGQTQKSSSMDKPKKTTRPGALNMSDLAKKFEEKPSGERKKVMSPFKVSDARKAFEAKADKSFSESPRRKPSVGSGDSFPTSPRESLPTSPKDSLPTSPRDSLPASPRESLPASPRDSLPTSPSRGGDKSLNKVSSLTKVSSSDSGENEASAVQKVAKTSLKESSEFSKEDVYPTIKSTRVSPTKDVPRSPTKDKKFPSKDKFTVKDRKSPTKDAPKSPTKETPKSLIKETKSFTKTSPPREAESKTRPKKELSPTKQIATVSSVSKLREVSKSKPDLKPTPRREVAQTEATTAIKTTAGSGARILSQLARTDTSDSSDSESEAERVLRELSEKREKLELAKKEKMKKVSEGKDSAPLAQRDMPAIREESQTPRPSPVPVVDAGPQEELQQETKEQKFATLPRGFKSKTEPIVKLKSSLTKVNSLDESPSSDSFRKKSQVEIVLNHNQYPSRQPNHVTKPFDHGSKKASFAEIQMGLQKESPRPEFRTEVQHSVGAPDRSSTVMPDWGPGHPEPHLQRARRERIIPIMLEDDQSDVSEPKVVNTMSRSSGLQPSSSRSSSVSSGISSTQKGTFGARQNTQNASPELIKKSRRERIIPIAVEGEGLITPPVTQSRSNEKLRSFHRQGSSHGSFGRGRVFGIDRTESFSSAGEDDDDEEDDGFQILTAESLFSTLLSRVRSLTRKMTADDASKPALDRLRRTPQSGSGVNSESPLSGGASGPSGFWSSLYSPPRELPNSRRVSETLLRGHSRDDDQFGMFGGPLWGRAPSRDASDAESSFSEHSAPFSTLPRGWRARRSGREESVLGAEGLASFTPPSRRELYSRTLSRDLPIKTSGEDAAKRSGSRSSWDATPSSGTLPRSSAAAGQTLQPRFGQEQLDRVASSHSANSNDNISSNTQHEFEKKDNRERLTTTNSLTSSGEAKGRVGGHYKQRDPNLGASLAFPITNLEQSQLTEEQFVQQLKDPVRELDTSSKKNSEISENIKGKVMLKLIPPGQKDSFVSPKPSKSLSSFQKQHSLINHSGSNPNIVFSVTISSPVNLDEQIKLTSQPKHINPLGSHQADQRICNDQNSNKETQGIFQSKNTGKVLSKNDNTSKAQQTKEYSTNSGENSSKNTFIPYNPNLNPNSASHKNFYIDKQIQTSADKNIEKTLPSWSKNGDKIQPNDDKKKETDGTLSKNESTTKTEQKNGYILHAESQPQVQKPGWNFARQLKSDPNKKSANEKNFLTVDPYRRGKTEDLNLAIELTNASDSNGTRGPLKLYKKSKSRDITPTIEAASEKFTQLNSGTLKRISPFEAYRRSKSRELGSAIDLANRGTSEMKMKPIQPSNECLVISDSCMSQFEKARTSIEKKFEKAKSPPLEPEIAENKKISPDPMNSLNKVKAIENSKREVEQTKDKQLKDPEKTKSVYKMITSKFTRSLSNVGEEKHESSKQSLKDVEEENDKDDKFKLKKPSIFLKTKIEKNSSRTSFSEINDEAEKSEKKSNKLSYALNKFLGRKSEDKSSPVFPKKSTSAAIISEKPIKTPRFRAKLFSKSNEHINQNTDDDETDQDETTLTTFPESEITYDINLESATKDICNHLSQIEINLTSRIGNMSPSTVTPPKTSSSVSTGMPSITSYGLSPALASKRATTSIPLPKILSPDSHFDTNPFRKKSDGEQSEDGRSITPSTESGNEYVIVTSKTEETKEPEDESVMDRITRKSYYSRFNETKRKPKIRRIDSRDSMDQQLAAAKARLMQEEQNDLDASASYSRIVSSQRASMASSPPPAWDGVTRRNSKTNHVPRTTSLPPEEDVGFYGVGIVPSPVHSPLPEESLRVSRHQSVGREQKAFYRSASVLREDQAPYRRQASINFDDTLNRCLSSATKGDPSFYLRQPSVTKDEQPVYRLPSVVRDETPTYRRLSSALRDEPQALRRSSTARDEPQSYRRMSSHYDDNSVDKRVSSVPKDDMGYRRLSTARDDHLGYHTLQYRKPSVLNDEAGINRFISPHIRDSVQLNQKNERYNDENPSSPSISPSVTLIQRTSVEPRKHDCSEKAKSLEVASAAGKAAGEAAAAAASQTNEAYAAPEEISQRIPTITSLKSPTETAAVKSAREELTRRLTPLTRLSNLGTGTKGSAGDSSARPYRRTVTSGNLPLSQNEVVKAPTLERPFYRRTTTMDLPPTDSRIRTTDYRRVLQDPSRRFAGLRY